MTRVAIFGAILGGGAGVRIGGRKAMMPLAGRPMAARVADILLPQVTRLAVVGDMEAAAALGVEHVPDAPGLPSGPLAGVYSAAAWVGAMGGDWLLVSPCDVPLLPADLGARLLAGAAGRNAAYVETADGEHPLVSLWRSSAAAHLREALANGHPPVRSMLRAVGAAPVWFEDAGAFMNVNTPDELRLAEMRLAARGR
jgi:molybdenum cofactor guanylyltransferase